MHESFPFRTLDVLPVVEGRRVLVRVDFNVPVDDQDQVTDDTRIRGALDTLMELRRRGAELILMSHRGRPKGWGGASMEVVVPRLSELLECDVAFIDDIAGDRAAKKAASLRPADVLLLQNLRYDPGEKAGDRDFARRLAALGEFYVNDAFGTAHRADASVALLPTLLPGYAGRLMTHELLILSQLLHDAEHPYWAVVGGSKVSDKVELLDALLDRVDGLAVGGGMANTFLVAEGYDMGASKVESEAVKTAKRLLDKAAAKKVPLLLPERVTAAKDFKPDAEHRVAKPGELGADEMALDVAPEAVDKMLETMTGARTVLWNGPMGVFEWDAFSEGTLRMAEGLANSSARVVVGGGDSVAAVARAGVQDRLFHVSTGGGATLEFLQGKPLPGVEALINSIKG
ncbi:phosphoglycerate kinase [Sulfobacillus harzensis]|uniref:Phosphoglycerate kinase n=1 Tax=Sulfobacillus harzensis TaxID=2729629 RepID=A0A7Y0Q2A4_9FIRM|nr:phosphoglycerate kinase [Sulfobacillus harzensis]NMP22145.1 phosphoglycerate kinase [Sulfobacillus harzensis]